ncbi:MAG TPA: large conductance mechanosensitive channel protein MscL [Tepidiformaceae bacterium]|nr:large conductance mechanosensitive channel protein MscL [Tepidiformaceae bacterium]
MNHPIIKEFRDFLIRGNLIELAVAFIMGLAFARVVTAFTEGIVLNFIAAIVGEPNFNSIGLDVGDSRLLIGSLITEVVYLILVGAAVFFFIVKPVSVLRERKKEEPETVAPPEDIELLREIRDLLKAGRP